MGVNKDCKLPNAGDSQYIIFLSIYLDFFEATHVIVTLEGGVGSCD
jgi:hypothetical protein